MDENEVIRQVTEFFERQGWKTKLAKASKEHFERDIVAEKEGRKYVIQAKGDKPYKETFQIQYAIGEIVAEMRETGPKIYYGLALPIGVAKKLWKFGVIGLKILNLHLFIVESAYLVYHISPDKVFKYMASLQELGEDNVPPSTFLAVL